MLGGASGSHHTQKGSVPGRPPQVCRKATPWLTHPRALVLPPTPSQGWSGHGGRPRSNCRVSARRPARQKARGHVAAGGAVACPGRVEGRPGCLPGSIGPISRSTGGQRRPGQHLPQRPDGEVPGIDLFPRLVESGHRPERQRDGLLQGMAGTTGPLEGYTCFKQVYS